MVHNSLLLVLLTSFCYNTKCDEIILKPELVGSEKVLNTDDYSYYVKGYEDFQKSLNLERNTYKTGDKDGMNRDSVVFEDVKNITKIKLETGSANNKEYNEEEMRERLDKLYGYTGPTANDEPQNLERPCALDDWECIRKFFAANGKCKPAYGPIPDPLYQDILTIFFPNTNLTAVLPNLEIRGLSTAKVNSFYINKKSGNLVFAFDLGNFNVVVPRAYIRYRRTAKESIILAGLGTINFRSSTFTAVIPNVPDLQLDLADMHVDVQDGTPPFFLSPEIAASPDPDVLTAFPQLVAMLPISIREGLLFEAQFLAALYIQTNICDFGLKFISV